MADPQITAALHRPFSEQVAAFRLRLGNLVPTSRWDDLRHNAHDRSFMVAGATKADLLADLGRAVDEAITDGTGLEAFRQQFREIVAKRGWTGWTGEGSKKGQAWRTRVIYQTNMRTSYAAGRRAQLIEAGYPLWIYRHGGSREPRPEHLELDGWTGPPDHPFWEKWSPPNGWGCSCYVLGARSERGAKRLGGDPDLQLPAGWDAIDPRSGTPKGISKGWDYAPGATSSGAIRLLEGKIPDLPPELGSALAGSNRQHIEESWPRWLEDTISGASHVPTLVGAISAPLIAALGRREIKPLSAEIMVSPGLISGPKARRHSAAGNALSPEDWRDLPARLEQPAAVLLDVESGRLLYILDGRGGPGQAAIAIDYRLKGRKRAENRTNMIVSAYMPNIDEVRRRIAQGRLEIITGAVR